MRLYDTYSGQLQQLPSDGRIRMYFCGPTVYQRIHVGNAVPFVLSMWLKRWLEDQGYETRLAINITDINDKIYDAAPGASAQLAEDATRWYLEDTDRLGLGRPDFEPTAVGTVPDQMRMIADLIATGHAYEVDGDVYFRVRSFEPYGALSNQRLDEVQDQEPNPRKEDPRDFALWKANKPGEDTSWESPWGRGRPGWHIECSAMSEKHLGTSFEIHGGGLDLVFPHHENEIAQSRALGHEFARLWMHNGMLRFRGEEMHKSLGNDIALKEVLDRWGRETLLIFFLGGHWRKPLDYSDSTMEQARAQWRGFVEALMAPPPKREAPAWSDFEAALNDDFNTPAALALMHRWASAGQVELLEKALRLFGIDLGPPAPPPDEILALADQRDEARKAREFVRADELREQIEALGWRVKDEAEGYVLFPRT